MGSTLIVVSLLVIVNDGALDRCVTATEETATAAMGDTAITITGVGGPGVFEVVILADAGIIDVGVLQVCVGLVANGEDSGLDVEVAAVGVLGMWDMGCDISLGSALANNTGPFCSGGAVD